MTLPAIPSERLWTGPARPAEPVRAPDQAGPDDTAARSRADRLPGVAYGLLFRQLRALAGPRGDLDDLVQAAAERALRAWPRFEGRSLLSTWTYGVAYRTWLDHERWHRRWRRRFVVVADPAGDAPSPGVSPELAVRLRIRADRLRAHLAQLPPAKRAVVVLHDFEGLPLAEVAAVVGANERTVRSRHRDAHQRLGALLRADPLFEEEAAP